VELVLLLDLFGRSGGTAATGGGNRDRGRGLDVERLLESLHELGQLKEGHLLERVEQVSAAELCHDRFPSFLSPESLPAARPPRPAPLLPVPLCPQPRTARQPRAWRAVRRQGAPSASAAR